MIINSMGIVDDYLMKQQNIKKSWRKNSSINAMW